MINYIALFSALLMTIISGYVSIIGLTSIFSSPSGFFVIFTSLKLKLKLWLQDH